MDDKNFDESIAKNWIKIIESPNASMRDRELYPRLNQWVANVRQGKVLDVGCGQGIISEKLPIDTLTYHGVDPSQTLIQRARLLYERQDRVFSVGNIYDLKFSEGQFDGCLSVLVWHLLSDINKASAEISRVLKPDGHFHIVTANPKSYDSWKRIYTQSELVGNRLDGTLTLSDGSLERDTLYLHTESEIRSVLSKAGLDILEFEEFYRPSSSTQDMLVSITGVKRPTKHNFI